MAKSHDGIGMLLVAYLILGGFMAVIYARFRPHHSHFFWNGVLFGAGIGVLWVLPHGLAMVGAHGEPLMYVLKNAAWQGVEQAFGGATIAALFQYRRLNPSR